MSETTAHPEHIGQGVDQRWDVVVVGGGAAGLSAALTLARARRTVLIVDAGQPRNAPAAAMHGYLTRDGIAPADLIAEGAAEVTRYGGAVTCGRVSAIRRGAAGFTLRTDEDRELSARRVLLATGLVDQLPDIPGLEQRWGRDVLHCPYCHGWEHRDQPIGVLATGPDPVSYALLWRQWSPDVMLLRHTAPEPTDEQSEQLAARDIPVIDGPVTGLELADDQLTGVRLSSGRVVARHVLALTPWFAARAELAADLGLALTQQPGGTAIEADDPTGRTSVRGLWVAGNTTDLTGQVIGAAASGVTAARAINADLVAEDTHLARQRRRHRRHDRAADPFSPESEARLCERVLGDHATDSPNPSSPKRDHQTLAYN